MTDQVITNATPANAAASNTPTPVTAVETPASFDQWLADQPANIQELFDTHVDGLKSALTNERDGRKELEKQLRTLGKQADKGSELETQLGKLADDVKQSENKAAFYEGAHEAGVKNLKLAWIAAKEYDVFDRSGNVDFGRLKAAVPELFATSTKTVVSANAGAGANQQGIVKPDMNNWLRTASGHG